MRRDITPEPDPFTQEDVFDAAIDFFKETYPDSDEITTDLSHRCDISRDKYGAYLTTFNGRNALRDAYQESLDLYVYLVQARLELESNTPLETMKIKSEELNQGIHHVQTLILIIKTELEAQAEVETTNFVRN